MKKEEAISYLQQLYPNGGHCWLDEQRIEAIGMAVKALQEEPVSEDLEVYIKERVSNVPVVMRSGFHHLCRQLIRDGAKWQKEQTIVDACYHLEMRLPEYLNYNGIRVERKEFIEDYRKALDED